MLASISSWSGKRYRVAGGAAPLRPGVLVVFIVVVLVAGCGNRSSGELEAKVQQAEKRLDAIQARLKQVEAKAASLDQVISASGEAVGEAQAKLKSREEALASKEAKVNEVIRSIEATSFGDGTHEVGKDIVPGKYKAAEPTDRCYWEKLTGGDGLDSIIANDMARGPTTVVISKKVPFFKSRGCGTWVKVD